MKIDTTTNNWKPVIASFLDHMSRAGFRVARTDNGEEEVAMPSMARAIEELTACDEARVWFQSTKDDGEGLLYAFLVLGNAPHETVADYTSRPYTSAGKRFDEAIQAWSDDMEGFGVCPCAGMNAGHYLRMARAFVIAADRTVPDALEILIEDMRESV
jgi:hypothetical protein